ncbi:MAG TPA: TolC family protein [Bacteroidetes bacterium]|nr:outer membrane protein TolC precursor [bacterium BMS3Bbin04]HDO66365.1 TolC family protein [Bacteroidota bacterium]HEX05490.1 TolC family protein [Bacteroidota bacterium]
MIRSVTNFNSRLTFVLLLLALSCLVSAAVSAETADSDTLELDLYKAVAIALGESPDAFYSQNSIDQSYLSFRSAAIDMYSPQFDIDLLSPSLSQSLNEQLVYSPDQGQTVRQWIEIENERMQGQLGIDQPLPTGGQIRLESVLYRRFYSNDLTGDENDVEYSSTYRVNFSQELLRGNLRRYAKEQAELVYERARLNALQSQRGLVFNVLEAYYGLLASWRELEITSADLSANQETASLAERKYEAGLIPEVEALQMAVEAARVETELLSAQANYDGQLDRFRDLIGIPLDRAIRIVGDPSFEKTEVSLDDAIEMALQLRNDIRMANIAVDQAELGLKNTRRPWKIGGQLTAFYNLDLRADNFESSLSDKYQDYAVNRGFAVNVNIPLFSGGRKNIDVQTAQLALRRARFDATQAEKGLVLEVRTAVRSLNESRRRYEISLSSLEIAEKSFDISRQRFVNGQITAREWIDAQNSVNRIRISTSRAIMDHNVALARYRLTVGENILSGVVITSPKPGSDL